MNKVELKTPVYDEEAPILPDGWENENFLNDPSLWEGDSLIDESGETSSENGGINADGEPGELNTPTTGEENAGGPSAAQESEESGTDGNQPKEESVKRILKLKVNHEEQEVDVNGMTDEELKEQLQKARAFDAMKDDQAKARYRQIYQDQIDAGMTAGLARMVADHEVGKSYPLEDPAEEPAPTQAEPPKSAPAAPTTRDFVQEVKQLKALYPDFKETPDEVAMAVAQGTPLLTAYVAYREKQTTKTAASLKRENEVLKHNAASAAKAPVKGVTGGGSTNTKPQSPFVSGFTADEW